MLELFRQCGFLFYFIGRTLIPCILRIPSGTLYFSLHKTLERMSQIVPSSCFYIMFQPSLSPQNLTIANASNKCNPLILKAHLFIFRILNLEI